MDIKQQAALVQLKKDVWRSPLCFFGSGFGLGMMPFAPGTFATLGAVVCYWFVRHWSWWGYLLLTLFVTLISIWVSDIISKRYKLHDPTVICLDEFVGFFVTMILVPTTWPYLVAGFVLFRFFDIVKPGPIGYVDRHVHGGFGMVLDDVIAGVFSCVLLQLFYWISILTNGFHFR